MAENMIKAGRAGLTFGGDWDETVEYNRLVGVRYDNKLFFSKKTVPVGLIPEDGEYWFLAYEGLTDAEWTGLLERLGNMQFVTTFPSGITNDSTMEELIAALPDKSIFVRNARTPLTPADYCSLTVIKYSSFYVEATAISQLDHNIYMGGTNEKNAWNGWKCLFTTDGGTLSKQSIIPLYLNNIRDTTESIYLSFLVRGVEQGRIGFASGAPYIVNTVNGKEGTIFYTGNKPSGTYTGNGDATQRDIATGGIGRACLIWASDTSGGAASTLLMQTGGFGQRSGQSIIFAQGVARYESGGTIRLLTADASLNEVGKTYTWIVI